VGTAGVLYLYGAEQSMAFVIRKASGQDLAELRRLWQERKEVYLKNADPSVLGLATADAWQNTISAWLTRSDVTVLVADREGQLIGYMIGWVRENLPLLTPAHYGLISEMSVDGHCKQGGVGTALFQAMQAWFKTHHLDYVEVRVPRLQPIEQAFWRALGAEQHLDELRYRLS
jgi:GNAT superfamily N-acetyltransferase